MRTTIFQYLLFIQAESIYIRYVKNLFFSCMVSCIIDIIFKNRFERQFNRNNLISLSQVLFNKTKKY